MPVFLSQNAAPAAAASAEKQSVRLSLDIWLDLWATEKEFYIKHKTSTGFWPLYGGLGPCGWSNIECASLLLEILRQILLA